MGLPWVVEMPDIENKIQAEGLVKTCENNTAQLADYIN